MLHKIHCWITGIKITDLVVALSAVVIGDVLINSGFVLQGAIIFAVGVIYYCASPRQSVAQPKRYANNSFVLYAAFSEYHDIWPTTIRYTLEECIEALASEPSVKPGEDPLKHGICIGEFDYSPGPFSMGGPANPHPHEIRYVKGFRADNDKLTDSRP